MTSILFISALVTILIPRATWQQRCQTPPTMTFRGGVDVTRGRNAPMVVLFAPVQCANCYNILKRLNDIGATNRFAKVVVVAPDFESNHVIARTSAAFPFLQIDRVNEGWTRLGVRNFDAWIIDSCGRLTEKLTHPSSDVTSSQSVAISLSRTQSVCGPCNPHHQKPADATWQTKKLNAYWDKEQMVAKTTSTKSPLDDYEYYDTIGEQNNGVATTVRPQTQIPRPPQFHQNWPTPTTNLHQHHANYPQHNTMEHNNLPCSAYTDDICYHQLEKFGTSISNCCSKGVYLTDVCVPGKCSNSTIQLCCFQKFLQAKYACCSDPRQDEQDGKKSTNMFNKCCRETFVMDDPCCPRDAATTYWSSVYEVCFPNINVNYSMVRFEVNQFDRDQTHFKEGIRVIDLAVNRQWDYKCAYGSKRLQYAYLP